MKTIRYFLILFSILLLSGCSGLTALGGFSAQPGDSGVSQPPLQDSQAVPAVEQRRITVTGSSQVLVIPDEVVLTLGVETADLQLAIAQKANDEIVKQVFEVASDMQIDSKICPNRLHQYRASLSGFIYREKLHRLLCSKEYRHHLEGFD